jgi:hypothetical protein
MSRLKQRLHRQPNPPQYGRRTRALWSMPEKVRGFIHVPHGRPAGGISGERRRKSRASSSRKFGCLDRLNRNELSLVSVSPQQFDLPTGSSPALKYVTSDHRVAGSSPAGCKSSSRANPQAIIELRKAERWRLHPHSILTF